MKRLFAFVIIAFLCASCEDSMFLRSEKKMKEDLQGKWQREFLGDTSIHHDEFWIFSGSTLYTTREEFFPPDTYDNGAKDSVMSDNVDTMVISGFSIDARVFKAFLKLQPKTARDTGFVDRWEFIELSNVMDLAADNPIGPGVVQREFYKVK
jgi:hypothetical protein